ncbi:MAG: hypothetical protein WAZ18_04075 [Alphaproteobacteria bacterium]
MDPLSIPARVWIKTRTPYRKHRLEYWHAPNNERGSKGQVYTDSRDQYGQDLGYSDVLAPRRVDNCGWFTNTSQDAVIRGSVTRIRGARFTLYVPVTGSSGWDGAKHYIADAERVPRGSDEAAHEQAIHDAAATADHHAELEAEQEREHDIKDQAEQTIETERENIRKARAATRTWAAELRNTPALPPTICRTITEAIKTCREQVCSSVARIRDLTDNPYLIERH